MQELRSSYKQLTMSSVEISELVGSRHDKVKQSIERLAKRGAITLPPTGVAKTNGRPCTYYLFGGDKGKRDSYVVVAQLSPEFTSRLVDRWHELEQAAATPLSLEEMTLKVIEGQRQKLIELERKIEEDAPHTNFGRAISQTAGSVKIGDWIKAINEKGDIKIGRNLAFKWFRDNNYLCKNNTPYQQYINRGLFEVKEGAIITDTDSIPTFTTLLTGKGQAYFAHKLKTELVQKT